MVETRIARVKLVDLKNLEVNARYMTAVQFNQLVENLKRDGALTSAPLVYRGEVLSGNHRVKAAIAAGIEDADVIEITSDLSHEQKIAIQLSHNEITGQDDPNVLHALYTALSLDWKKYTGLTDDKFKLEDVELAALTIANVKYQELVIQFLPEERQAFVDAVKRIEKDKRAREYLLARIEDFETFFQAISQVKLRKNIHNSAVALRVMADLALAHLGEEPQTDARPK